MTEENKEDGKKTNAELSKEVAALSAQCAELVKVVGTLADDVKAAHAEIASIKDNPAAPMPDFFGGARYAHLLNWTEKVLHKYHHNDEPEMKVDDGPDGGN